MSSNLIDANAIELTIFKIKTLLGLMLANGRFFKTTILMEFEPAHERKGRQACAMHNLARAVAARTYKEWI